MIELLGSYTESTASQARDDAQKCIISAISDPNTFLMDHLLTLKPVKLLEGEKIYEVSGELQHYFSNPSGYVRPNIKAKRMCNTLLKGMTLTPTYLRNRISLGGIN